MTGCLRQIWRYVPGAWSDIRKSICKVRHEVLSAWVGERGALFCRFTTLQKKISELCDLFDFLQLYNFTKKILELCDLFDFYALYVFMCCDKMREKTAFGLFFHIMHMHIVRHCMPMYPEVGKYLVQNRTHKFLFSATVGKIRTHLALLCSSV